jgi:hypothetical protein
LALVKSVPHVKTARRDPSHTAFVNLTKTLIPRALVIYPVAKLRSSWVDFRVAIVTVVSSAGPHDKGIVVLIPGVSGTDPV